MTDTIDNNLIFEFYIIWFYFFIGAIVITIIYKFAIYILNKLMGRK